MKTSIVIVCLLLSAGSARAQTGVSNQRDMYGNLVREGGTTSPRSVNQGPANNAPIRIAPVQPSTTNAGKTQTMSK
jgi:hypothetical protein